MELPAFIAEVRQGYVALLRAALARAREADPACPIEAFIQFDQNPPDMPPLAEVFRRARADAVLRDAEGNPQLHLVRTDKLLATETLRLTHPAGMAVQVQPFDWGWCELILSNVPEDPAAALGPWLVKWMDWERTKARDEAGLSGVIHGVVPPRKLGANRHHVTVDFGSAPVEALGELLDALAASGVRRVQIFT